MHRMVHLFLYLLRFLFVIAVLTIVKVCIPVYQTGSKWKFETMYITTVSTNHHLLFTNFTPSVLSQLLLSLSFLHILLLICGCILFHFFSHHLFSLSFLAENFPSKMWFKVWDGSLQKWSYFNPHYCNLWPGKQNQTWKLFRLMRRKWMLNRCKHLLQPFKQIPRPFNGQPKWVWSQ